MKQNKKGFTLIELLAVIVILAIIALIATPIVLNMISQAKESASKSSALGYVDSINSFIPLAGSATDLGINDEDYTGAVVPTVTCTKANGAWSGEGCAAFYAKVENKTKGGKPTAATITITNGQVAKESTFTVDGYDWVYSGTSMDKALKGE